MVEPLDRMWRRSLGARPGWRTAAVFGAYLVLAAVATWPLLRDISTRIASDAGDPLLNTSVLLWNATVTPFSAAWWNAPHYYPSTGIAAFTENLAGVSPLASPVYWLTGNPILAYNLSVFVTWPCSALAAYLLVRFLTKREDAAILSGLAFGFSPYRVVALAHIQTLATFGVPLMLLGMHGYLERRRWPWLVLLGLAWLQQGLANGYYILYGGLLAGLWLVYFGTRRDTWKAGLTIAGAFAVFSLPLVPLLLKYHAIHEYQGIRRTLAEILYFSAQPRSWFETDAGVWLWHSLLPSGKDNMFPGVTAVAVVIAGIAWLLVRRRPGSPGPTPPRRGLRVALGVGTVLGLAALLASLYWGHIDTTIAGVRFKMTELNRALTLLLICGVPLAAMTPRVREALARRSALVFYAAGTILVALLSCGPNLRVGDDVIWKTAPYGWLMALPGFSELRVPTQIKMIDLLCLAIAAGLAHSAFRPARTRRSAAVFAGVAFALLLDGWPVSTPMAEAPALWSAVEPADRLEPILELPLGPAGDFAATFRAASHHRRVLNGVSGYDPPHYYALKSGLEAHDPAILTAVASLGAFDIVVDGDQDPDGSEARYAAGAPGAVRAGSDGTRTLYRVPKTVPEPALGEALPIAAVGAVRNNADSRLMHDGVMDTGWGDYPQKPDAWVTADLGQVRDVGGVTNAIGEYLLDFPRRLVIESSLDGRTWERAWEGPTFAQTFLAFVREPRRASLHFQFQSRRARYVRLRQVEGYRTMWRVSELLVHAPRRPAVDLQASHRIAPSNSP